MNTTRALIYLITFASIANTPIAQAMEQTSQQTQSLPPQQCNEDLLFNLIGNIDTETFKTKLKDLLTHNPQAHLNPKNTDGFSLLHYIAACRSSAMLAILVEALLEQNLYANINPILTIPIPIPFNWIVQNKGVKAMFTSVSEGVRFTSMITNNAYTATWTPLKLARFFKRTENVQYLKAALEEQHGKIFHHLLTTSQEILAAKASQTLETFLPHKDT